MSLASRAMGLVALASVTSACASPRTEVLLVVDSDLSTPEQLDTIAVTVVSPDAVEMASTARLGPSEPALPRVLGLVHETGPVGPFLVTVTGSQSGSTVVVRHAEFSFVAGQTRMLRLALLRSCRSSSCSAEQTCAEGGCRARAVAADELEAWDPSLSEDGDAGGSDAGVMSDAGAVDAGPVGEPADAGAVSADAGAVASDACVASAETCDGRDEDCDARIDEGFDLDTDPLHCGRCGAACDLEGAVAGCAGGLCVVASCEDGRGDCDGDAMNGCETDITNRRNCGGCGIQCRSPTRVCCPEGRCAASC